MNHIGILGAGAIGQLKHFQLSQLNTNQDIFYFIDRHETRRQEVNFTSLTGNQISYVADCISAQHEIHILLKIQLLIVCVKSYQVTDALLPILDKLNPQCHILLLHNGMGPHLTIEETLRHSYPSLGLSLGTTSQGAIKHDRWHIEQTGTGLTQFGHYFGPVLSECLKQTLLSSIHNIEYCDAIIPMLWQKLAVNAAINPLTAINQCKNGELNNAQYRGTIEMITDEVISVAQHDGIQLNKANLLKRIFEVITLTQNNFSSMYQDIRHHRQSEVDNINGYIIQRAKKHQLAVPENIKLYRNIKQIENNE